MIKELTYAEVTALVAQNLRDHALKPARLGLSDKETSECRKQISELAGLRRPKSIVHLLPGAGGAD